MKPNGFTLVEISIVMIIIGLLIGGTFGGMKLIENMEVNKTVQQMKAIESAALTFKDTYGRLPGDVTNPAARLPNCTTAPCATGGNGNRIIGTANLWVGAITNTDENFTFWHHLQAADLLSNLNYRNTTDMTFGEGQPETALGNGYRIGDATTGLSCTQFNRTTLFFTADISGNAAFSNSVFRCISLKSLDDKVDDGLPRSGGLQTFSCFTAATSCDQPYEISRNAMAYYDLKGF